MFLAGHLLCTHSFKLRSSGTSGNCACCPVTSSVGTCGGGGGGGVHFVGAEIKDAVLVLEEIFVS